VAVDRDDAVAELQSRACRRRAGIRRKNVGVDNAVALVIRDRRTDACVAALLFVEQVLPLVCVVKTRMRIERPQSALEGILGQVGTRDSFTEYGICLDDRLGLDDVGCDTRGLSCRRSGRSA